MERYDTLYHVDAHGNVRVWWMERDGDRYRSVSGIDGGELVTSEWKVSKPKNVGRSNATTGEEQARLEVQSQYTRKLDRKYTRERDSAGRSNIIEPMLADKFKGWDESWKLVYSQPKLDGMRCIATKDGLFSRLGKPIASVPHINAALESTFAEFPNLILDGELYNHDLRDDFNEIISIAKQVKPTEADIERAAAVIQYHVYDMIHTEGFSFRYTAAHAIVSRLNSPFVRPVPTEAVANRTDLDAIYSELLENGYEGQMIRLDEPYEQKRSKRLLKRKEFIDEEFEVLEIIEGQGNWSGYAKSVRCRTSDGVEFNAGIRGTQEFTRNLLRLTPMPRTVTVRYQNKTPDGSLRFPIAVAFYEGERDV